MNNINNFNSVLTLNVTHKADVKRKFDAFNLDYWNINSIKNKIYLIENDVNSHNGKTIHFIALSETRIKENETTFYNLPNYKSYFNCRKDGHGGVALYVHESVDSNLVESDEKFKINYVIVNVPAIRSSIAVIYKKPTVSIDKFLEILTYILTKTNRIILVGDTNINIQNSNNHTHRYHLLVQSLGSSIMNSTDKKFHTRKNKNVNATATVTSTIDHIISNNFNFKFNLVLNDSHFSDHKQLSLSFKDQTQNTTNFASSDKIFTNARLNVELFRKMLAREISLFNPKSASLLLRIIENTKKRCTKQITIQTKKNPYKGWVNRELLEIIDERNRYHKMSKKYPNSNYAKQMYTYFCSLSKSKNNQSRREHNSLKLNNAINKPKQLWRNFNEIIHNKPNTKSEIQSITLPDGTLSTEPNVIANTLNYYFCNIGFELITKLKPTEPTYTTLIPFNPHTMALFPITNDEITYIIHKTKRNSNLNDILPIDFIKKCSDIIVEPLVECLNNEFQNGNFPTELKIARVVPIFKAGDTTTPANYRPISIVPDFSKILEQCIYNRLVSFANKHNIIAQNQFGFQEKSGTMSAAICLLDYIRTSLNSSPRNIIAILFIDVTKAFDSILRELLLKKLFRYGFRGKIYELIKSFLTNRKQFLSVKNSKSDTLANDIGTPQGSTLGPALFNLFINDIFKLKLNGKIVMYADDAAIEYTATSTAELDRMINEDLITLSEWFTANKLMMNLKKTKCMIIHRQQHTKRFTLNISLNNERIEQVNSFEYLGLILQENLNWDLHVKKVESKVSRMTGVLHRLGNSVYKSTLISIYYSHVYSHLIFMAPIWGNSTNENNLSTLQVIQNNALRTIFRTDYYANGLSTNEIKKKYCLLNIKQIVKYETAMLAYKVRCDLFKSDIKLKKRSQQISYNLRNPDNLFQQSFKNNSGKNIISRLVAIELNTLPNEIKTINSLFTFKKKLKKHICTNAIVT